MDDLTILLNLGFGRRANAERERHDALLGGNWLCLRDGYNDERRVRHFACHTGGS